MPASAPYLSVRRDRPGWAADTLAFEPGADRIREEPRAP